MWHSMGYAVAKELGLRPRDVLMWDPEELVVAFGVYANQHAAEAYEMAMAQFKKGPQKPKLPKWTDRWAVLFMTEEQVEQVMKDQEEAAKNAKSMEEKEHSMAEAASILFGN